MVWVGGCVVVSRRPLLRGRVLRVPRGEEETGAWEEVEETDGCGGCRLAKISLISLSATCIFNFSWYVQRLNPMLKAWLDSSHCLPQPKPICP
jgi:hypothetical protein